jgi:hypothetical protein
MDDLGMPGLNAWPALGVIGQGQGWRQQETPQYRCVCTGLRAHPAAHAGTGKDGPGRGGTRCRHGIAHLPKALGWVFGATMINGFGVDAGKRLRHRFKSLDLGTPGAAFEPMGKKNESFGCRHGIYSGGWSGTLALSRVMSGLPLAIVFFLVSRTGV